jgi:phosphopantothenoylcysteine decarboxylase/phosphopantothenate--cysteine ligase
MDNIVGQDIFIACAAVSDYSIKNIAKNKIKKSEKTLILELI